MAWLTGCAAAVLLLVLWYRKQSGETQRRADKGAAWFLIALMVFRYAYLAAVHALTVYELPLHLCSMAGFLCLLHAYRDFDWTGQVLYALCLPGTLSALIFPDWIYYPPIHCITIEGFLFHFGVLAYVCMQLCSGRIRPGIKKLWKLLVFLAVTVPPVYVFNKHFHTNYFFVNVPSPGSPLELFADIFGVPGYLYGYAALVLAIIVLMELAGGLVFGRRKS